MSRGVLIAIVAGIIAAAIAAGVVALTAGDIVPGAPEGGNVTQGRHLTLDLDENLALKENP
ncbi:hypothetical protein [Nitrososphaera sp.]|uniref:hypothetical protein n=1 Tax=Nitrososphaera sp. TaxID=1971748 RepID=UPI001836917B|nr:hypothetical protein [Nitrososphaera sp.]NWG37196.1 hypothetical protein [Nitrososphaera sp.]